MPITWPAPEKPDELHGFHVGQEVMIVNDGSDAKYIIRGIRRPKNPEEEFAYPFEMQQTTEPYANFYANADSLKRC